MKAGNKEEEGERVSYLKLWIKKPYGNTLAKKVMKSLKRKVKNNPQF